MYLQVAMSFDYLFHEWNFVTLAPREYRAHATVCLLFIHVLLQGAAIWHPRCGPGPGQTNGNITLYLNGENQGHEDRDDHISSSAASETQVKYRLILINCD